MTTQKYIVQFTLSGLLINVDLFTICLQIKFPKTLNGVGNAHLKNLSLKYDMGIFPLLPSS